MIKVLKNKWVTVITQVAAFGLIILFTYAALSKLLAWRMFTHEMLNQPFPTVISRFLVWVVPISELVVVVLLLSKKFRLTGFILSFGLLLAFTVYVALVLVNFFGRVPCSCGGVLQRLGWEEHLVFNVVFLVLAGVGWWVEGNEC